MIEKYMPPTNKMLAVLDPSTGEAFAETADSNASDVVRSIENAASALPGWRTTSVAGRAAALRRLGQLVLRDLEPLAALESRQTGKPLRQALRDGQVTARYFDFYASAIETFHADVIPFDNDTLVYTRWEPHGITTQIIPWNYPMSIMARSIAPALAMGNVCIVKPAEETPLTALRIASLALEAGVPEGVLNVVTGDGETAGAALVSHPSVGHISFTGSVEVGRIIGKVAAENIVPVTMELGGKSPNIVFPDANLDRAVPVIVNAILQNAGQTCSAGSRLIVHRDIHAELVGRLTERFSHVTVGMPGHDPDLGPLISSAQRDRVQNYVDAAREASIIRHGGHSLSGGEYGSGFFFEPTLIDNVDPESPIGQEEVFGPVLAISTFGDMDEAITIANGTAFGLVAGVWTGNLTTAHRMIQSVVAGQVFVNAYGAGGGVEFPFGGFRHSGFGREKGVEGLRGFGQIKTAVIGL